MRYLFILNPGIHAGRARRLWRGWQAALDADGVEYECAGTAAFGEARVLARQAQGVDAVVAVGGARTIHEVWCGLLDAGAAGLPMGVLYTGNSPDFCRFHGIPAEPKAALAALLAASPAVAADAVRITYADAQGEPQTAFFCASCNIGFGSPVARFSRQFRRYLGVFGATAAALVSAIVARPRLNVELGIDGETFLLQYVNHLCLLKNPRLGGGLRVGVDARPNDGMMYLLVVHNQNRAGLCTLLPALYRGTLTGGPGLFMAAGRKITVRSHTPQEIEFDSVPRGFLPVTVELLPGAIRLLGVTLPQPPRRGFVPQPVVATTVPMRGLVASED